MRKELSLQYFDMLKKPKTILDIGFGWGAFLEFLPKEVESFGIDNNKIFVKYGEKKGLKVKLGNANKLEFKNEKFDAILSDCVIEHLDNRYEVIKEWSRVLKKGGRALIIFPNIKRRKWEFFNDYTHKQPVHPRALIEILKDNGFKIEKIDYEPTTPKGFGKILFYLKNSKVNRLINTFGGKIFSYKTLILAKKL